MIHSISLNFSQFWFLFFYLFFYCSGFCHTLKWNSHGFTCVPHPDPPSHLPLHPIPLGLPSAPGPSACLMHPTCHQGIFIRRFVIAIRGPTSSPVTSIEPCGIWVVLVSVYVSLTQLGIKEYPGICSHPSRLLTEHSFWGAVGSVGGTQQEEYRDCYGAAVCDGWTGCASHSGSKGSFC